MNTHGREGSVQWVGQLGQMERRLKVGREEAIPLFLGVLHCGLADVGAHVVDQDRHRHALRGKVLGGLVEQRLPLGTNGHVHADRLCGGNDAWNHRLVAGINKECKSTAHCLARLRAALRAWQRHRTPEP